MEDTSNFIEKMMELGIGISMIKQMPGIMDSCMPKVTPANGALSSQTAPPPTQATSATYIVVDDSQAGPFSDDDLVKLAQDNLLTANTLVWKPGMTDWLPAVQVPDVNRLFLLAKIK
jgi:hypothetical protein